LSAALDFCEDQIEHGCCSSAHQLPSTRFYDIIRTTWIMAPGGPFVLIINLHAALQISSPIIMPIYRNYVPSSDTIGFFRATSWQMEAAFVGQYHR
jgi:hypothetical protein